MPAPVDRFGAVSVRSLSAGAIDVNGSSVRASDGGRLTVVGSLEFAPKLNATAVIVACFAGAPPGPGYTVEAEVVSQIVCRIAVRKTSPNGLALAPATVPVEVHWIALGS